MHGKLSRRKLAQYVAERVREGQVPESVIQEVAAYLVESRRLREMPLVVRSIEDALAERGVVVATVTSARPLTTTLRDAVKAQAGDEEVYLREVVDPSVIGGVRVQTPDASYDGTVQHKLQALRAAKV
ncbi:MAG: F0F1 ATP synthase subunit delta [Candidatus Saccharimonadales bacterium]|jgi:F-type H+-transporting ATPase subunit delta